MIYTGDKLIAWDSNLRDVYFAIAAKDEANDTHVNPLVRIVSVIRYPMQCSIMFPDYASENCPIAQGVTCRLVVVMVVPSGSAYETFETDYQTSLNTARETLIQSLETRVKLSGGDPFLYGMECAKKQLEILYRHRQGEYKGNRTLLTL